MIQMQYITNEKTGERRLYYRTAAGVDASGAWAATEYGPWHEVPELTLDEASMQDLRESGGIAH